MLKRFFVLLIALTPIALMAQAPVKGPLDNKKYTAEITEEGKKKPLDPDDLTFQAGKFKSSVFSDWGFKPAKYQITEVDSLSTPGVKIYSFIVEQVNDSEEKLSWSGSIKGDDMDGTIELIGKKGQVKKKYSFTATLKKKPGQK